ncbi:hypothetical protein EDC01DRAFT_391951 [Geopyxis carbonaria]|nr:hypothetical protein EDC01DRAFT_391951 [Geopyxis carbonaria]
MSARRVVERSGLVEKTTTFGTIVLRTWVTPEELRESNAKELGGPAKMATPMATPDPLTPAVPAPDPSVASVPTIDAAQDVAPKRKRGRRPKYKSSASPSIAPHPTSGSPVVTPSTTAPTMSQFDFSPSSGAVGDLSTHTSIDNHCDPNRNSDVNFEWLSSMQSIASSSTTPGYMPHHTYFPDHNPTAHMPSQNFVGLSTDTFPDGNYILEDSSYLQDRPSQVPVSPASPATPTTPAIAAIIKPPRSKKKADNGSPGTGSKKKQKVSGGAEGEPKRVVRNGDAEPLFHLMSAEELSQLRKRNRRGKTWIPGHVTVCRYLESLGRPLEVKEAQRMIWLTTHPGEPFPPYLELLDNPQDLNQVHPSNPIDLNQVHPATPASVSTSISPAPIAKPFFENSTPVETALMPDHELPPHQEYYTPLYPPMTINTQYIDAPVAPVPQTSPVTVSRSIQEWQQDAEELHYKNPYYRT